MDEARTVGWRWPLVVLAAIGAAVALWLGVSAAVASGGSGGSNQLGSDPGGSPSVLVQDDDARGGRDRGDCPNEDGGGGSGSENASESV